MKITLMMAITADGRIAKYHNHPANWTSKADKKKFIEVTKKAGVMIMGKTTYDTIGRPLPGRLNLVLTRNPNDYKEIENQLKFFFGTPKEIIKYLQEKGYKEAILCGGTATNSSFAQENLIDEMILTIEPKIFGGGLSLFKGVDLNNNLELLEYKKLGDNSIYLHYKIIK